MEKVLIEEMQEEGNSQGGGVKKVNQITHHLTLNMTGRIKKKKYQQNTFV